MFQSRSGLGVPARGRLAKARRSRLRRRVKHTHRPGLSKTSPGTVPVRGQEVDVAFHGRGGAQLLPAVDLGRPPR